MRLVNDIYCAWINDLKPRTNIKVLENNEDCDWLIIGAGITGLSAAREIGSITSKQENNIS